MFCALRQIRPSLLALVVTLGCFIFCGTAFAIVQWCDLNITFTPASVTVPCDAASGTIASNVIVTGNTGPVYLYTSGATKGFVLNGNNVVVGQSGIDSSACGSTIALTVIASENEIISLWGDTDTPVTLTSTDTSAVTVGVKFIPLANGTVEGVKFYKGALNTGVHVVDLWSASGTPLATATVVNETATGWQQVLFPTPIQVSANTTYVASYHTNVGRYSADAGYFNASRTNSWITAPSSATSGGNGVFVNSANDIFPTNSVSATNYWVDVLFCYSCLAQPVLVIVFAPAAPSVPENVANGTTVTTVSAIWTDGAPFTGTLAFGPPNFDAGGKFVLSGNSINRSGSGVLASATSENITIVATQ